MIMTKFNEKVEERYRVFGERIMVSKIMTVPKAITEKAIFKGEVLVVAVGDEAGSWGVSEGDKLIVSGMTEFNGECYVHKNQIMRWI